MNLIRPLENDMAKTHLTTAGPSPSVHRGVTFLDSAPGRSADLRRTNHFQKPKDSSRTPKIRRKSGLASKY